MGRVSSHLYPLSQPCGFVCVCPAFGWRAFRPDSVLFFRVRPALGWRAFLWPDARVRPAFGWRASRPDAPSVRPALGWRALWPDARVRPAFGWRASRPDAPSALGAYGWSPLGGTLFIGGLHPQPWACPAFIWGAFLWPSAFVRPAHGWRALEPDVSGSCSASRG